MRACMYVCQCMYVMYVCMYVCVCVCHVCTMYVMYARCMLCAGGPSGQRVWTFYMCRKLVSRCCMLQAMSRFARRSRSMLRLVSRKSLFCQTLFLHATVAHHFEIACRFAHRQRGCTRTQVNCFHENG